MGAIFADNFEEITGLSREDYPDVVGPVSIVEAVQAPVAEEVTTEISEPVTKVITADSDAVETA